MDTNGDNSKQVLQFWIDFSSKLANAGASLNPFDPPADNARRMRGALFAALSESTDQFMRSPQFLEFLKQSSSMSNDFRSRLNEFMTAARHDSQGVAREDIDSVMANMRHMGVRILDRMEELGTRLEAISARLDALEGSDKSKTSQQRSTEDAPAAPSQTSQQSPASADAADQLPPTRAQRRDNESTPEKPQQQPRKGNHGRSR